MSTLSRYDDQFPSAELYADVYHDVLEFIRWNQIPYIGFGFPELSLRSPKQYLDIKE